jgi:hypothetical protein
MHILVLFLKNISRHFSYEHHKLCETSYFASSLVMNTANYVKLLTLSGVNCMYISLLFKLLADISVMSITNYAKLLTLPAVSL